MNKILKISLIVVIVLFLIFLLYPKPQSLKTGDYPYTCLDVMCDEWLPDLTTKTCYHHECGTDSCNARRTGYLDEKMCYEYINDLFARAEDANNSISLPD